MAVTPTSRRAEPPGPPPPDGLAAFVTSHRSGLAATLVAALAMAGGWLAWTRSGTTAVLRTEDVELLGVGPWIHGDLRTEALRNASLDGGLPLHDPELARRLARAFDIHPWVREVVRVELRHPAAATVEIRCREPVAMIRVPGGLLPVDAEGVTLPAFDAEAAARYPRVGGVTSGPRGPEGTAWGDPVVEEAAALAAVLGPDWEALRLAECRPVGGDGGPREWEITGDTDVSIRFGSAPGHERPGEPTAAMKVARLRALGIGRLVGEIDLRKADAAVIPLR